MGTAAHFHDDYLTAWNEAMASGDSAPIEAFLAPDYHGWLGQEAAAYEMTYRTGGSVTGRALLMESWQLMGDRWILRRDFTEVNTSEPAQ